MTLFHEKLKKGIIWSLAILLGMVILSGVLAITNPIRGASLGAIGDLGLYEYYADATEFYARRPIMLIGTPIFPYDLREQYTDIIAVGEEPFPTQHWTIADVRVLEVIKNETDKEIDPGDIIRILEYCGYTEFRGESVFTRGNEYSYPLTEQRPYAFFLREDPKIGDVYTQYLMGSFDLSTMNPTQRERESIPRKSLRIYARFKKSIFDVPDLLPVLIKYMGYEQEPGIWSR